jgi:electron transport complex protein RnfE
MNPEERIAYGDIGRKGLWENNTALVQLLGLCPLLAVSNSLVNAVSLSLATVLVMALSSGAVAALRTLIPHEIRIPVFILIIAALVTCPRSRLQRLAARALSGARHLHSADRHQLHRAGTRRSLRSQEFASGRAWDGAAMGVGLLWVLALLGGARELIGAGTLFSGIDMIIPGAQALQLFGDEYHGLLIAILPPGAFILLGLLIAARNAWVARAPPPAPDRAARARRSGVGLMATRASKLTRAEIQTMFERFRAANPHPKSDLEYGSAYQLLVAVVLSAQATDKGVNVATRKLFRIAPTPEAMVSTGRRRRRGPDQDDRPVPRQGKECGRAVAPAARTSRRRSAAQPCRARSTARRRPQDRQRGAQHRVHEPTMAVDTHIFRIANRIGLAPGKDVLAVEHGLLKVVPAEFMLHAHHWLILHGRYTCTARKPTVDACDGYDVHRLGNQLALNSLLRALPPELREEARLPFNQLFVGEVTEALDNAVECGRFRVLPLISVNHDDRSVTLGHRIEPGARLFWGLRSPLGAEEDMRRTVDVTAEEIGGTPSFGVLFSCMGRGPYFYGGQDRDLDIVRNRYPGLPLIGAYSAGQIAPLYEGNALIQNSALLALIKAD